MTEVMRSSQPFLRSAEGSAGERADGPGGEHQSGGVDEPGRYIAPHWQPVLQRMPHVAGEQAG
jgi:hypothetical protein